MYREKLATVMSASVMIGSVMEYQSPMTTHTFPFDDIGRAFAMMTSKEDGIIKPLITFG